MKSQKCHISFYRKNVHLDLSHMLKFHEFWSFYSLRSYLLKNDPKILKFFFFTPYIAKNNNNAQSHQITMCIFVLFFLQFMEWKLKFSKFWGHFSINKISMNKKSKIHETLTCDSSQDVHSSYKKKCDILTFHKKFFFHRNFIQIIMGLKIVYLKWNFTWR